MPSWPRRLNTTSTWAALSGEDGLVHLAGFCSFGDQFPCRVNHRGVAPRQPVSMAIWWNNAGRMVYPQAGRPLISADGGGSNGYRVRAWKYRAGRPGSTDRADDHCVPPTTRHLQMEQDRTPHADHIYMNWRGRPLTGHQQSLAGRCWTSAPRDPSGHPLRAWLP